MSSYKLYGDWPAALRGPFNGIDDHGRMGVGGFPEAFAKAIEELAAERPGEMPRIGAALARIRATGVEAKTSALWVMYWDALGRALGREPKRLPDASVVGNPLAAQSFWNARSRETWIRLKLEFGRWPNEDEFCRALGADKCFGRRQWRFERTNQWIEDGRKIPADAV